MENRSAWRARWERLKSWEYLPFLAFGLFMLVLHLTFNTTLGDDDVHAAILAGGGSVIGKWLDFMKFRYFHQSARQIIDSVMIFMIQAPLLWKVLDTLVLVLIGVLFARFFNEERSVALNWFIAYALFAFPLRLMRTAGWVTTSMNYTWPLAFGMYALTPLVNALRGRPTKRHVYALSILVLPYAVNHEQMCCVFLALCAFLTLWLWLREHRVSKYGILGLAVCAAMLVYMLTCPGTAERGVAETEQWFPEFANLTFLQKVELGYSSTLYKCFMEPNLVFGLLALVLMLAVYRRDRRTWARLLAAVPLAAELIMGTFGELSEQVIPYLAGLRDQLSDTGTGFSLFHFRTWMPDAFITLVLLCLLAGLWLAFRERRWGWLLPVYLLLVGLASRMVMGFSPTIWASRERTFTFAYFLMLAVAVMLARGLLRAPRSGRCVKLLQAGLAVHFIFIVEEYMYYLTKI